MLGMSLNPIKETDSSKSSPTFDKIMKMKSNVEQKSIGQKSTDSNRVSLFKPVPLKPQLSAPSSYVREFPSKAGRSTIKTIFTSKKSVQEQPNKVKKVIKKPKKKNLIELKRTSTDDSTNTQPVA